MAKTNNRRLRARVPLSQNVKHSRYQAAGLPVFQESAAIDVSSRGISFETERPYQKGDLIFLEIQMEKEPLRFLVCVAWVKKGQKANYEVGAELMGIDPGHQKKMQKSLEKLNRQSEARRSPSPRKKKISRKK